MAIDDIIREKCIKELADLEETREEYQGKTDDFSIKVWGMLNYANGFALMKLPLGIDSYEVERYRKQKDVKQYEFDFEYR